MNVYIHISEFKNIKAKNVANALEKVTYFLSSYGCSYEYAYVYSYQYLILSLSSFIFHFLLTSRAKDFDFKSRLNRRYCTTLVCAKCLKNDFISFGIFPDG